MKYYYCLALAMVSGTAELVAQSERPAQSISLELGYAHIARQDLVFAPFVYKGGAPLNFGLAYARNGATRQELRLHAGLLQANNTAIYNYVEDGEQRSTSPSFFTLVDLDYFIGRNIASSNRCRTALGLVFSADVQALNYVYGRLGSFGYYSFFGLGLGLKHEQAVGRRGVVTAALHVPLVGWQARSPYLVNDDEFIENTMSHSGVKTFIAFVGDGSFKTIKDLQTADVALKYEYVLSPRWDLGLAYRLEFIHAPEPRKLLSYRNGFSLVTKFNF